MKEPLKDVFFSLHESVKSECIFGGKEERQADLSIVIPTYKRKDLLRKTVKSILNQKKPEKLTYHVIIVSNDPDYDCDDLIVDLPANLFSIYRNTENIGMVGNMNRCAYLSQGKYVAYIQDDDILLDNYLVTIERLLNEGMMEGIDCLIPNRYYYYDQKNNESNFGKKAYSAEKKKKILKCALSIGIRKKLIQPLTFQDCADTWYNCFAGGPTCGMLFRKNSLMNTKGFPENYPYAFDFVFFIDFSSQYTVALYDEFLSIYRMAESATNRAEVQADFYQADLYLLERAKKCNGFVKKYEKEIIHFSRANKSAEARNLIPEGPPVKPFQYLRFRLIRFIRLMRSNVYRREITPEKYWKLL